MLGSKLARLKKSGGWGVLRGLSGSVRDFWLPSSGIFGLQGGGALFFAVQSCARESLTSRLFRIRARFVCPGRVL